MTDADRSRLIEVMASATMAWRYGAHFAGKMARKIANHDREMVGEALMAAERAGFKWSLGDG